jgi:hypothetical protein
MRRLVRAPEILLLFAFLCSAAWGQSIVRSPDAVRGALAGMNEVVEHSGRLIASRDYSQLPGQANEFEARLIAFEQGIGSQPSELKSTLEPLIAKARVASNAMSEAAQSHRDSLLPLTHQQLAGAVSAIIAAVPPSLRPTPSG